MTQYAALSAQGLFRTSLGSYKHKWTCEITDTVRALLTSKHSRAKKLKQLNNLAETKAIAKDRKVL